MNSIQFPKMFNSNSTNIVSEKAASSQDLLLLLKSEKGEFFGDPFFGVRIRKYLYDQNNYLLKDLIIDEIYTQMKTFCPQLYVDRRDIKVTQNHSKLNIKLKALNRLDYTTDTYELVLFEEEVK